MRVVRHLASPCVVAVVALGATAACGRPPRETAPSAPWSVTVPFDPAGHGPCVGLYPTIVEVGNVTSYEVTIMPEVFEPDGRWTLAARQSAPSPIDLGTATCRNHDLARNGGRCQATMTCELEAGADGARVSFTVDHGPAEPEAMRTTAASSLSHDLLGASLVDGCVAGGPVVPGGRSTWCFLAGRLDRVELRTGDRVFELRRDDGAEGGHQRCASGSVDAVAIWLDGRPLPGHGLLAIMQVGYEWALQPTAPLDAARWRCRNQAARLADDACQVDVDCERSERDGKYGTSFSLDVPLRLVGDSRPEGGEVCERTGSTEACWVGARLARIRFYAASGAFNELVAIP